MTFSIGGKLAGGLFTVTSVSATVAAPYAPKLIDKYVLTSSSSKVESFSSDSSYLEESEIVVSDESFVPQAVKVAEDQVSDIKPQTEEEKVVPVVDANTEAIEEVVEQSPAQEPAKVEMTSYSIPESSSRLVDDQLRDNQDAYDRIKKWLTENGSCQISFVIKSSQNLALDFKNIKRDDMRNVEIFVKDSKLGKSKFRSFADQLESKVELSAKYIEQLSEGCKKGSSKKLYLHWRNVVNESKMSNFKGLRDVWVDHESLFDKFVLNFK